MMSKLSLGEKIKECRISLTLTQKDLAGDFITRNMLSQIENNQATPSIKTLEYLAARLKKSVGYFIDDSDKTYDINNFYMQILNAYDNMDYRSCISLAEKREASDAIENEAMALLTGRCFMQLAKGLYIEGQYAEAFEHIRKAVIYLEKAGAELSETLLLATETGYYLNDNEKINDIMGKCENRLNITSNNYFLQKMYKNLAFKQYDAVIEKINAKERMSFDEMSEAKFQMIIGLSFYHLNKPEQAVLHLLSSLSYYENHENLQMTKMICERLSKCYSLMQDYKNAYEYLERSKQ